MNMPNFYCNIEIDNNEQGVTGDFTTMSDIRITKAEPDILRDLIRISFEAILYKNIRMRASL